MEKKISDWHRVCQRSSRIWPTYCCSRQGKCLKSQRNNLKLTADTRFVTLPKLITYYESCICNSFWSIFWNTQDFWPDWYRIYWPMTKNGYEYNPLSNWWKCFLHPIKDNCKYCYWWRNVEVTLKSWKNIINYALSGYRHVRDNAPSHTSKLVKQFFKLEKITVLSHHILQV